MRCRRFPSFFTASTMLSAKENAREREKERERGGRGEREREREGEKESVREYEGTYMYLYWSRTSTTYRYEKIYIIYLATLSRCLETDGRAMCRWRQISRSFSPASVRSSGERRPPIIFLRAFPFAFILIFAWSGRKRATGIYHRFVSSSLASHNVHCLLEKLHKVKIVYMYI